MPKYGTEYRLEWLMMDDATIIRASIFDANFVIDPSDDTNVIDLRPSGNPLSIKIIENDRNKFTSIKSRQAIIEFLTSSEVGFETFADSSDNRWYVTVVINPDTDNKTLFLGFLSLADMQEDFLPDPNIMILTATDHLGMLKDIQLTDDTSLTPTGHNKIAKYIAWCLQKTGLSLDIFVVNNLRHGTGTTTIDFGNFSNASSTIFFPLTVYDNFYEGQQLLCTSSGLNNGTTFTVVVNNAGANIQVTPAPVHESGITNFTLTDITSGTHFYNFVQLDAKSFDDEIGTCENCYQVLEKILGYDCFITQYNGAWWIFRIDEWDSNQIYVAEYDFEGVYQSLASPTDYNKSVGSAETLKMALADMILEADRPHGVAKLTYTYTYPLEVPCNSDFSRGDLLDDSNPLDITYELDCWTLKEGVPGHSGTVDGTTVTIHRIFNADGYEDERYIVLTPRTTFESSSINDATYIESQPIPIEEKDKFTASIDFRLDQDIATGGNGNARLFRCILHGDDGSYWILGEATTGDGIPVWYNTANWTTNTAKGDTSVDFDEDDTEWRGISWAAPPAPVTGNLYIWLNQFNQLSSADDNRQVWYNNLNFEYQPFINGSYASYKGQYQKVSRTPTSYLAKIEDEVYISDSPKKLFKGALKWDDSGDLVLTDIFYPHNVFPTGTPSLEYAHPYGELQIRSVFNQYRNANRVFTGSVSGLGLNFPDLIHKYSLTDINPNTDDRYFMMTQFEQNWKTGFFTATFIEVWNTDGKVYSDDREFKYITQ